MMKIIREECIGCGRCASTHPDAFRMVGLYPDVITDEIIEEAIDECPTGAITK